MPIRLIARFGFVGFYAFLAGILASLSANLFTTVSLTQQCALTHSLVYGVSGVLLISSASFAAVGWMIQRARGTWEREGCLSGWDNVGSAIGPMKVWIVLLFTLAMLSLAYAAAALASHSWVFVAMQIAEGP